MIKKNIYDLKLKTLKKVTIISALIFFSLSGTAGAWYLKSGYSFDVIGYVPYGAAKYVAGEAETYWNKSRAKTRIGAAPQAKNPIYWGNEKYEWYGLYKPGMNMFSIWLNQRTIKNASPKDYFDMGINVAVHEFGHALHLAHPPNHRIAGNSTIMSHDRKRTQHAPRKIDVDNLIKYRGKYKWNQYMS